VESKLGPLGTSATEWPIVPAPGDYDDGEIGGMKIGRGKPSLTSNYQMLQLFWPNNCITIARETYSRSNDW
jgi:hypothetical protein